MIKGLFDFIKSSPSAYHTVASVKARLAADGYVELEEGERIPQSGCGKYYVTRNGSSIIAFRTSADPRGFMIVASHSDSPAFRLKMSEDITSSAYATLDVERYGGMIMYSWLDRPLSVAGRVVVDTEEGVEERLVSLDRDLAVIPSVAIHLNRGVNDGYKFNPARDMLPLYALGEHATVLDAVADELGVCKDRILSHDLFLFNRDEPRRFGADGELILAPRLDDLGCVFSSLEAFLASDDSAAVPVLAVFDNEEVGSDTKQGAASGFLDDTLAMIGGENYARMLRSSFMVSADNAHARHPNHPELSDAANAPTLGGGVVVKYNANQKYATDGLSASVFGKLARISGAKIQTYYNRADLPGGSTLGSISDTRVGISTVDIGLPQLAMHSANETAGASDVEEMVKILTAFYSASLERNGMTVKINVK